MDVVNEHLNGYPVRLPEYREYATRQVADTIITDCAISELIGVDWSFELITKHVSAGTVFSFEMTAAGIFFVDWGDGKIEKIVRDTNDRAVYRHEYEEEGVYGIKMRGYVTKYANAAATRPWPGRWAELAAILFENNRNIAEISGSLGAIFSTLPDGTNPNFQNLFNGTTLSGEIPVELFKGISGQPTVGMFANAFSGSSVSKIPEGLFSDIVGVPTEGLFSETFLYCRYLKGDLPENLFAGISGAPADDMFNGTFYSTGVTSIPENLFVEISGGAATGMFLEMFVDTESLTGKSARIGGKYLYEIWPDADQVGAMV